MEQEITGLIENHHKAIFRDGAHKFSNVIEKLRNPKLSDPSAWTEFQQVLSYCVEDYPDGFSDLQEAIRSVFDIRRRAFFEQEKRDHASTNIRQILSSLPEEKRDLLDAPVVCIRDLFDVNFKGKSRL